MRIQIHDVGHGLCISLRHDNGNVMLWDCGHKDDNRPSEFLPAAGIDRIDRFFVTNYDEDHISDLPNLRVELSISTLHRNTSISKEQLQALKRQSGPLSEAMQSMLEMISLYNAGPPDPEPDFPGVRFVQYCNTYLTDFHDSNNISLVTFLGCNGLNFVIPGDLEEPGWNALLGEPSFRRELQSVHVFIASHHGRENGYCREVFDYCSPSVVVFSDSPVKYATQQMASIYGSHASGVTFNGVKRHVLSTRNDGSFGWTV